MNRRLALILAVLAYGAGCGKPPIQPIATKPPEVWVSRPVMREVQDSEEFPGRIESVRSVEIRAQVTGALEAIHFDDGKDVVAGQKLFTIDSRVYRAEFERTKASLTQAKAHLDRLTKDYERLKGIAQSGASSKEEFDRVIGDKAEADAAVGVAEAALRLAQTNLDYCTITAPFSGKVSRRMMDPGNLIKANESPLTTLVAVDPIYATFEVDERTHLKIKRFVNPNSTATGANGSNPVKTVVGIALSDESGFPRTGVIDFTDVQANSGTGTIRMRAVVDNKLQLLSPGLFCRMRLPVGPPHQAVVIPEEAVGSDQGQKYVFVVTDQGEVQFRPVQLGFQVDKMRVIESGLATTDRIIVKGLQRVRAGIKVTVKEEPPAKAVASSEPGMATKNSAVGGHAP